MSIDITNKEYINIVQHALNMYFEVTLDCIKDEEESKIRKQLLKDKKIIIKIIEKNKHLTKGD